MAEQRREQRTRFDPRRRGGRSDAELVAAVGIGDRGALEEIAERETSRILGVARMVCGDDRAQDVVQDVLLALWQNPHRFDASRGSLRGFLLLQAQGRAIDMLRSEGSRSARERATHERELRRTGARGDTVEDDVLQHLGGEAVHVAMARLPVREGEAIALAYFGGRSYREVAVSLGRPEGTVKGHIRTGLARLASLLADQERPDDDGRPAPLNFSWANEG